MNDLMFDFRSNIYGFDLMNIKLFKNLLIQKSESNGV